MLAKKLNADEEIVELAALLHDITRLTGDKENHHITGQVEAEKILKSFDYPEDKIERVKHCIHTHRGSKDIKRETVESEVVASADAFAVIVQAPAYFYYLYVEKEMEIEEGKEWLKKKVKKSWNKLMQRQRKWSRIFSFNWVVEVWILIVFCCLCF